MAFLGINAAIFINSYDCQLVSVLHVGEVEESVFFVIKNSWRSVVPNSNEVGSVNNMIFVIHFVILV